MTRYFCDKCGAEQSPENPILEYQITAKMEAVPEDDEKVCGIEWERMEVCQPCATLVAQACKKFVEEWSAPLRKDDQ